MKYGDDSPHIDIQGRPHHGCPRCCCCGRPRQRGLCGLQAFAGAGEIFWWPFCVPVNSSQRARCARRGALQARLRSGVQLPFQDRDPLVGRAGREFRSYLKGCVCQPCRAGSSNRDAHDFPQDVGGWRRGRCHCGPWARSFATSPRYCCIPAGAGQESTAQQCEGMMSP